jgi:2-polyprenyl-3-methyl-5-hydroxy-6-metoxy-1,4-benzoquinol methylase
VRDARHASIARRAAVTDDPTGRDRRARRVLRLLHDFGAPSLAAARLLDLGCRQGAMSAVLAANVGDVTAMDVDQEAITEGVARYARLANLRFVVADGTDLPFRAESFDVVVCNHVYEHVTDADKLMAEIHRVLRADGVCYFAGGHTFQLIEPHHRLPLLACLPRPVADMLVRATGKGPAYAERFLAPWRIRSLFTRFSQAVWLTAAVVREPERYELLAEPNRLAEALLRRLPAWTAWLAPTYLWLLRK